MKKKLQLKARIQAIAVFTAPLAEDVQKRARHNKNKPKFKPPMKAEDVKTLKKLIDTGNSKGAVSKLQDMNEALERFEKRIKPGGKRH